MRSTQFLACLCALATLPAQGTFDLDKTSPGTLGSSLTLEVQNAGANRLFGVMMSYDGGPTAIAPFDPADSRSVNVGLELATNWYVLGTDAQGSATITTALPNDPVFQGHVLHWQCATLPGATTILDAISNPVRTHLGQADTGASLPGALLGPRATDIACDLGDGDLLLVGPANTERFRFRTLDSTAGPAMVTPRALAASARLNDGRFLFVGGIGGGGTAIADCEIYDPTTDTFTAVAPMQQIRAGHVAATLSDGRVLVVGGTTNFTDLIVAITSVLNTAEIYDPANNTWSSAPNIGAPRLVPALTTLSTGDTLLSGGIQVTLFFGIPIAIISTTSTQLFDPNTNSWSGGASMPSGRAFHQDNQVTLNDGRVLLTGGVMVPSLINALNATAIDGADLYDPVTNTWTATTMSQSRFTHSATELPDGRIIVCGGTGGLLSAPTPIDGVESLDPVTNTWSAMPPLGSPRAAHTATVMPDGLLVILGGGGVAGEAWHF